MSKSKVTIANVTNPQAELTKAMRAVSNKEMSTMKGRITRAVNARGEQELSDRGERGHSADFAELSECWIGSDALAAFFVASKIDPKAYLMMNWIDESQRVKHGFSGLSKTKNLKAYRKLRGVAELLYSGNDNAVEPVFATFFACSYIASEKTEWMDYQTCYKFLNNVELTGMDDDLAEQIAEYRNVYMSGGAPTQSGQCILTLINAGAGRITKLDKRKHFRLDLDAPLTQALAEFFRFDTAQAQ